MPVTPTAERVVIDGRPHWKYQPSDRHPDGLILPAVFGGSEEADEGGESEAATAPAEPEASTTSTTEPETTPATPDEPRDLREAGLGDRGKAALDKERNARRAAETKARQMEAEVAELAAKVKEFEDAGRSDEERREQRLRDLEGGKTAAEQEAAKAVAEAARLRVALRKGLTETQAKRLVGETEEELEQDADDLLASFKTDDRPKDEPRRRPQERLKPGGVPDAEPEVNDPAALAKRISAGY